MRVIVRSALAGTALVVAAASSMSAQELDRRTARGWELVGLPALNFTSDEGIGYGVLAEIYNYGDGLQPYRFTIQPTLFLTTKGRRDLTVFFDAPKLLPRDWRLDAFAGIERQLATPYYGEGNSAPFDEQAEQPPNPYFYRYGRRQVRVLANLQHKLGSAPARALVGAGFVAVRTDATPFDSGTTLLAQQLAGSEAPHGNLGYVRAGLVWDSRNREIGPRTGTWSEVLVQRVDRAFGGSHTYTRATVSGRKYVPLAARMVFAQRALLQQTDGDVPLYDLATIQTSFKQQEGLGGGNTVRGLPKNRFVGKGIVVSNSELRWRFTEFDLLAKPSYLVLSAFLDAGRVWTESIKLSEALSGLHAGYGGGLRLGLGPSFIVAFDLGRSSEATQLYIGLGYPF